MPIESAPQLEKFLKAAERDALIRRAQDEDLGSRGLDLTTRTAVPADRSGQAAMTAREPGHLSGIGLLPEVAAVYDPHLIVQTLAADGDAVVPGQIVARFRGRLRSILAMERVALNFMCHLSGIATLTRRYVDAVAGTGSRIYDTRKTLPGLRGLQKFAVACGGGCSHRFGLYDAMLVKDNHLAHVSASALEPWLSELIQRARNEHRGLKFIEVEVDRLQQLEPVLRCGADLVLLDNMANDSIRQAVELRNRLAPQVQLEASGRINLDTVRQVAETGVERVSVGALTQSAPALDLGWDIP